MGDNKQQITVDDVIAYLDANPEFFLHYPDALENLVLSSAPAGTISLAQRQAARLQTKNSQLQEQLHSLIETARQNNMLQARVHDLCLKFMDMPNLAALLPVLMTELKQQFNADEIALKLFYSDAEHALPDTIDNITQCHIDDVSLKVFDRVLSKQEPVCGRLSKAQKTILFGEVQEKIASIACLPIGHEPCCGLLAIASYDEHRFDADMATDYLAFLGEILMRLFRMHFHVDHDK